MGAMPNKTDRNDARGLAHPHDPARYRQSHPIENLFARLKDWRRIVT